MRIRLPDNPLIYTTVMFMVLFAMLGLSIRSASEPPYEEMNEMFIYNVSLHKKYNLEVLQMIEDNPYGFRRMGEAIVIARQVHTATQKAINALQLLRERVKSGTVSKPLNDSISTNIAQPYNVYISSIRAEERDYFVRFILPDTSTINRTLSLFERIPLQNRYMLMQALENYLLFCEYMTLNALCENYSEHITMFDAFEMIAIPSKSWVYPTETVEAMMMLIVYNRTVNPQVITNTGHIDKIENGFAEWSGVSKDLGLRKVDGNISAKFGKRKDEYEVSRRWSFSYLVLAPGASMSIDNMHMIYAGIANPITVSAPGYNAAHVSLRVPGAVVKKIANGKYEVRVIDSMRQLIAYLDATNEKGKTTTLEAIKLKVIPPPKPSIDLEQQTGGNISLASLNGPLRLAAEQAEDEMQLNYIIQGFEYSILHYGSKTVSGPFEAEGDLLRVNEVSYITKGDRLILSNIRTTVGGTALQPATISYTIQ
jgi:hypothetical protein